MCLKSKGSNREGYSREFEDNLRVEGLVLIETAVAMAKREIRHNGIYELNDYYMGI